MFGTKITQAAFFGVFSCCEGPENHTGISCRHLATTRHLPVMVQKMDAYGLEHTVETFEGRHFANTFERREVSLSFISDHMALEEH